jgi:hypothetical protein
MQLKNIFSLQSVEVIDVKSSDREG